MRMEKTAAVALSAALAIGCLGGLPGCLGQQDDQEAQEASNETLPTSQLAGAVAGIEVCKGGTAKLGKKGSRTYVVSEGQTSVAWNAQTEWKVAFNDGLPSLKLSKKTAYAMKSSGNKAVTSGGYSFRWLTEKELAEIVGEDYDEDGEASADGGGEGQQ